MKKILVVLLVLIGVASGAFAQDFFASYNKPGDVNLYGSVGWYYYVEASVAAEYIIGEFELGTIPFDWGVEARGGLDFWGGGVDFGIGALASLHLGLSAIPIEFYVALGVCYNNWGSFPVTVASYNGATWWFSKNIGLLFEGGYLGWGFWGVGIEFKI
jgi:hypothetical protein